MGVVDDAFQAMFFGEYGVWFGMLIFISLCVALLIKWKYSGILILPIIMGMEMMYYDKLQASPNTERYAWPMIILLVLAVFIAFYVVEGKVRH